MPQRRDPIKPPLPVCAMHGRIWPCSKCERDDRLAPYIGAAVVLGPFVVAALAYVLVGP